MLQWLKNIFIASKDSKIDAYFGKIYGFKPSAWNIDSFVNDFLLPTVIVITFIVYTLFIEKVA
jgi:hypothetical protein